MKKRDIKHTLEERILSGHYSPGYKLNERDLAAEFGVSRTPIRDILTRLSFNGLVIQKTRQGTYVKKNSIGEIIEWLQMLAVLESACARLAARAGSIEDSEQLTFWANKTIIKSLESDQNQYTIANKKFHEIIYLMSNNQPLINSIKDIRRKTSSYRKHIHRTAGVTSMSAQEHLDIAQAISARDEGRASDLMFKHLDMQRKEFTPFIAKLTSTIEKNEE